ncbi:hypothetical protein ACA910_006106 [Epithemia clementina (nom. ined.)]
MFRSFSLVVEEKGVACTSILPLLANNNSQAKVTNDTEKEMPSPPEAMVARIEYYKERYRYEQPATTITANHSTGGKSQDDLCGTFPSFSNWFNKLNSKGRSRHNEDSIIYNTFFKDASSTPHGTYVEIGAYDGVEESNTRFFDVCLGWSGLLVEGNPIMWNRIAQNRPTAHRMSFIPSCSVAEQAANKTIPFHPIGSTNTGVEAQDRGVRLVYNRRTDFVQVPCGSLTQVFLDVFPQGRVSFWSLDVEGSEHLILEKMDFNKVFVEMLMVEVQNSFCRVNEPCESRDRSREILQTKNGYIRFSGRIPASDIFIHPLSTHLLQRAKQVGWIKSD